MLGLQGCVAFAQRWYQACEGNVSPSLSSLPVLALVTSRCLCERFGERKRCEWFSVNKIQRFINTMVMMMMMMMMMIVVVVVMMMVVVVVVVMMMMMFMERLR